MPRRVIFTVQHAGSHYLQKIKPRTYKTPKGLNKVLNDIYLIETITILREREFKECFNNIDWERIDKLCAFGRLEKIYAKWVEKNEELRYIELKYPSIKFTMLSPKL